MRRHKISGIAFRWRMAEPIGRTPVPTLQGSPIRRILLRVVVVAIAVSALLLAAAPASAFLFGPYVFRDFENTDGNTFSLGVPSINDSGTISLAVRRDATLDGEVRVYREAQIPTVIADTTNFEGFFSLAINNNNTVVFEDITPIGRVKGLYTSIGGLITTIVEDNGSFSVDGIAIVHLDPSPQWDFGDNGEVVFRAVLETDRNGIFGRNVAGGGIFRRTTDADVSEFVLTDPVVNGRGDFAASVSFRDGVGSTITRQQIISNFGTIMDTNNEFAVEPANHMDMNNAGAVAFRQKLDSGFHGIFKSTTGEPPVVVADTSGPFQQLTSPSINRSGSVAFLATLDAGGGKGIFRGPNPVTDKIIGIGDVIGNRGGTVRTVADITGFGNDGFSGSLGRVAFTVRDQLGTQYLIRGGPGLLIDIDLDNLVQLTTTTGSSKPMMQDFTFPSFSQTELMFDYRNLTPGATLIVYINDIAVGNVVPRGAMSEFASASIPIDPISLSGDNDIPEVLKFELVGGPGMTFQLDNIRFANFDLVNGDFSTGDLTGWEFGDGEGAAMVVGKGLEPVFVPEPATGALGLLNLFALSLAFGRRRH